MVQFLYAPAADFSGDDLTTLTNAVIDADGALTGLTNGTAYRALVLSDPSPSFTPSGTSAPVLIDTVISGTNTATNSFAASNPAYSTGDLVLVAVMNDRDAATLGAVSITAPNAETVTTEQATFGDGNSGADGHVMTVFSYVATAGATAGANITCANAGTADQYTVVVQVWDAGTFNTTTRLVNKTTTSSTAGDANVTSGAFTASSAQGRLGFICARAFDGVSDTPPTGWTEEANADYGALPGYAALRNAATTASESVTATTFTGLTAARPFVGFTYVVNPA